MSNNNDSAISCEEGSFPENLNQIEIELSEELTPPSNATDEINLQEALTNAMENELEERGGTLVYSQVHSIVAGQWTLISLPKENFPDPLLEKYRAVMIQHSGNPDLYVYGRDVAAANPWRQIHRGIDTPAEVSIRKHDLMVTQRNETFGYIAVYGHSNSQFTLHIFVDDVDCLEFPLPDSWVTLEWNPVCGCNNVDYSNPSSVVVAGITSYTYGQCSSQNILCSLDTDLGTTIICDDLETYDSNLDLDPQLRSKFIAQSIWQ